MGDICLDSVWTALGEAFDRQAATQASIEAVVVKAAEERARRPRRQRRRRRRRRRRLQRRRAREEESAAPAKKTAAEKAAAAEEKAAAAEEKATRCGKCKGPKKCMHGRICKHERERRLCKECGGSSLCEQHGRRRYRCKARRTAAR